MPEAHFPRGRGGSGVRNMVRPLLRNLGTNVSCQLTPSRGCLLLLIGVRGEGAKKGNVQFYFHPSTFYFTLLPLLYSVTESAVGI